MEDSTADLLMAAARSLRRRYADALKEHDITPAQSRALRVVADDPGLRLAAVAERLRMAPRSATEVIDALEQRGLVERRPDPTDRRASSVTLTDQGRRLRHTIDRVRADESQRYLSRLTDADRADLGRILRLLDPA